MPNKRIKKKIAKTNFCKSPVWHGAKIKTKDVLVQTYRGEICDWGFAVRKRPTLKACPICGKTRRAGFFKCCGGCAWIFEYREGLDKLFDEVELKLREQGAGLDRFYHGANVNIRVFIRCACTMTEAVDKKSKKQTMEFSCAQSFSLYEMRHASYTQKRFLEDVLRLYKCAKETAETSVDENGNAYTLDAVVLPVLGAWKTR